MPQITEVVQSLDIESPIDLFKLEITGVSPYYFTNVRGVVFNQIAYTAIPVKFSWVNLSSEGAARDSRLTVSDVSGLLSGLLEANNGGLGATLTATRTYRMFLDGESTADSTQTHPPVNMRVNRRTWEARNQIELELTTGFDLERKKLPARAFLRRCGWLLTDENCRATPTIYYDLAGNVTTQSEGACTKDSTGCQRYHGTEWGTFFGGFLTVVRRG